MKTSLLAIFLLFATTLWAGWSEEEAKITYLLNEISKVDGVFVRNGTEHTPLDAINHLKMKMNRAMNSWFTPDKEEWTAKLFIDKLASKSSLSGKPYQIKFKNSHTIDCGPWLLERLNEYPTPP